MYDRRAANPPLPVAGNAHALWTNSPPGASMCREPPSGKETLHRQCPFPSGTLAKHAIPTMLSRLARIGPKTHLATRTLLF